MFETMKEELIVQITCGSDVGTAFYVAPDKLLTAYHTVISFTESGNNIVKDGLSGDLKFEVKSVYEDVDIAVLTVAERKETDCMTLMSHRIKIGEEFVSYGYPDTTKDLGLRIKGRITQQMVKTTGDFKLRSDDVDDSFDYQGMSGAPIFQMDNVVGIVIEQDGGSLNMVSVRKLVKLLKNESIVVEKETNLIDLPESIAKGVKSALPNYRVIGALDEILSKSENKWVLLHGTPGCGKTTLSAGFKPEDSSITVLGRFFFKVPNDYLSRAIRCSEGYFLDWLESVFVSVTGTEVEMLTIEKKRKQIPEWFQAISYCLAQRKQHGLLIIDGLDELATDSSNRVNDILSLIPNSLPDNIRVILSCITEEILPADIVGKIRPAGKLEVTALDIAACEIFIRENSGDWEKSYSFIQAVANKTEGHPLYMNYLCRYIVDTFDSTTKEECLNEWVESLPSIGGDIRSYYEAVWKKADPKGCAYEILALLSQTRGAVEESQLVEMMRTPNPYEFQAATKEFHHLMKEQATDQYEIYHSSFRLFITEKMRSAVKYTNDQIALYCENHKGTIYANENYLHHVVNGQDTMKGLTLCNQEWADRCAKLDISPDLIMHDIKECLSYAVDLGLPIEVIRLMLLAQRIENRCDSIMVDNVGSFVDLNIALGKPEVALKYIVRDNMLLVNLPEAMKYLHLLIEMGYAEQASVLEVSIEAEIRKAFSDVSKKGTSPYAFAARGFLIIERVQSGSADMKDLKRYFKTLYRVRGELDEQSSETMNLVVDMIIAYQLSNRLRSGKKIDIEKLLHSNKVTWNEELLMLFVKTLHLYEEKDDGLHRIGFNEAFFDCLQQIEEVLKRHKFSFEDDQLELLLLELVDKPIDAAIIKNFLAQYGPTPRNLSFRQENGVDFDVESLFKYFQETMYLAYLDDKMDCPTIRSYYSSDSAWEGYLESLVARTAFITGTLYRMRAAKEDYSTVHTLVKDTLDRIDFSFDIRSNWQRSYFLPEDLMPFVYDKMAEIYRDFFVDKIDEFKAHLQSRMTNQLSLYREGYSAVLIRLAGIFRLNVRTRNLTLFLADETVKYVVYAVKNRSERCSSLLQICLEYALLNEVDKAKEVYKEVLNSSMGPDWYKEGQLGLINAIQETDISFDGKQAAHVAAIFEEASGEMTFQRYVQQSKDQFVGTLVKSASLADAIAYYKFETLPSADLIVKNAEEWKVDMPRKGDGYELGANHLIESSAICHILCMSKQVSPYIRYAVSELFWENWDKLHNDRHYAELHADLLNAVGEQAAKDVLIPRMAEYFVSEYYADNKGDYLGDMEVVNISEAVLNGFQANLEEKGFIWNRKTRKSDTSRHERSYFEKLQKLPTSKSLLDKLRKDIVSPLGSYWYSLDQFLVELTKKPDFDITQLLDVITAHFDVNVHPSKEQHDKFNWFAGKHEETDIDEQMIHFLIWFLIHPEKKVLLRAEDALKWLVKLDNRVIGCLIEEILKPSEIGLATASSAILLEITKVNPNVVLQYLQSVEVQKELSEVVNFSVSRNLYEIALLLQKQCGQDVFLDFMKSIIPDSLPDRNDVMFDNNDMLFIEHKIDKLNYLKVTGGREFAKPYLEAVKEMGGIEKMSMLIKSDRYAARSFYMSVWHEGRYDRTMSDILDRVLYGKIDYKRAARAYYAINS